MNSNLQPQERGRALTATIGGGIVVLGSFLPWISVASGFGSLSRSGMDGGDGILTLILGAVIAIVGVARLTGWQVPSPFDRSPAVAGVIVLAIALYNFVDIQDRISAVNNDFVAANVGAGLYALFVGGGLATFSGLLKSSGTPQEDLIPNRECPHCKSQIRADASVCPHCRRESRAWTKHEGFWWSKNAEGEDLWFDPLTRRLEKYVKRQDQVE